MLSSPARGLTLPFDSALSLISGIVSILHVGRVSEPQDLPHLTHVHTKALGGQPRKAGTAGPPAASLPAAAEPQEAAADASSAVTPRPQLGTPAAAASAAPSAHAAAAAAIDRPTLSVEGAAGLPEQARALPCTQSLAHAAAAALAHAFGQAQGKLPAGQAHTLPETFCVLQAAA